MVTWEGEEVNLGKYQDSTNLLNSPRFKRYSKAKRNLQFSVHHVVSLSHSIVLDGSLDCRSFIPKFVQGHGTFDGDVRPLDVVWKLKELAC